MYLPRHFIPVQLVVIHRWLGIGLCLFMAAWFFSGAVLMYVPFPSLSSHERLEQGRSVETTALKLSPAAAIRASGLEWPIHRLRLVARDGRPVYQLAGSKGVAAIWADDGSDASLRSADEARDIAARFSGEDILSVDGPIDYDQWTVHQGFDAGRPYFRLNLEDDSGTVLYVSQTTGEVAQRTTRFQRGWNYAGAVVHWIYPTVLRRHPLVWSQVVWWLSLSGVIVVVMGMALGIDQSVAALRSRKKRLSAFHGWMKWHHLTGLGLGLVVLTWMFSGWLSMDHGQLFSSPDPTAEQLERFRGIPLEAAAEAVDVAEIRQLGRFQELEVKSIASTPLVLVRSLDRHDMYSAGPEGVQPFAGGTLPTPLTVEGVKAAWAGVPIFTAGAVVANDVYRQVRQNEIPMTAIRVVFDDPAGTWVHVDASTGDIINVMDKSQRTYRWLYHGLHSLDFPGLIEHRPLWDIVVLALLTMGFAFSLTGVYIGYRRLRQTLRQFGDTAVR